MIPHSAVGTWVTSCVCLFPYTVDNFAQIRIVHNTQGCLFTIKNKTKRSTSIRQGAPPGKVRAESSPSNSYVFRYKFSVDKNKRHENLYFQKEDVFLHKSTTENSNVEKIHCVQRCGAPHSPPPGGPTPAHAGASGSLRRPQGQAPEMPTQDLSVSYQDALQARVPAPASEPHRAAAPRPHRQATPRAPISGEPGCERPVSRGL